MLFVFSSTLSAGFYLNIIYFMHTRHFVDVLFGQKTPGIKNRFWTLLQQNNCWQLCMKRLPVQVS